MPPVDVESPPNAPAANSLAYVRASAPVTRRQFRFLLFLTFLNTVLLAVFICGPTISGFIRSTWKDWQSQRAIQQQKKKQDALLQQAATYTAPADQVVYEENPFEAAKLLSSSLDFSTIDTSRGGILLLTPQPWQPPVIRSPSIPTQLHKLVMNAPAEGATVLLHALKNPAGEQRLVWILISAQQELRYNPQENGSGLQRHLAPRTTRQLRANLVEVASANQPIPSIDSYKRIGTLIPQIHDLAPSITWTNTGNWENGRIDIDPKGLFRFYAAQLDPADPSHFTIDYVFDGHRDTIDGYLQNRDRIIFVPRAGRIVSESTQGEVWDLFASPATRPAIAP